jgi:hypothetical protein
VQADELVANLESPLPATLPAGTATAVFCSGTGFSRRDRIAGLEILVDGAPHRPAAFAMPRPDVFRAHGCGFRSGFWGTVPIPARDAGTVELSLAVRLAGGGEAAAPLGAIELVEAPPRAPGGGDAVAICMATFEPDPALFRAQAASLRAQTDPRWTCVISDDRSSPDALRAMEAEIAGDERFRLAPAERRAGFYGNFERALELAPPDAGLIALCDQDDVWHPDKLAVLRAALGDALLVYSDQRLVDRDGRVLRETLWQGRRNNHTDLASLLVANTITGAATLFRREVAELALPFADPPGVQFHDHWIALVALAAGDVAYVDRPLYDYVQHGSAVLGGAGGRPRRGRLRGAYFLGYAGREVFARTLLARCGDRLTPRKRRALERFVAADRSAAALAWLAARGLRPLAGRTETLGSELDLLRGLLWRRAVSALATGATRPGRRPLDASFPPEDSFEQPRLARWRARV